MFRPNLSGPHDTAYFEQAVRNLHDVAWTTAAVPRTTAPAAAPHARPVTFAAFAWGHPASREALLADISASDLLSPSVARVIHQLQQVSLTQGDSAPHVITDTDVVDNGLV